MAICRSCGSDNTVEKRDLIHLDWIRECLDCGCETELLPRAMSRGLYANPALVEKHSSFDLLGDD